MLIAKIAQRLEALPPPKPTQIRMSCINLFDTRPKLDNFSAKDFTFGLSPLPLSKILVAFTTADRFFKRLYAVLKL